MGYNLPDFNVVPQQYSKVQIGDELKAITSDDDSFKSSNPQPDGMFEFPGFIAHAADLADSHKTLSASLLCAQTKAGRCTTAFWRDQNVIALIWRGDPGFHLISPTAWGRPALDKACQKRCDEDKIAPLFDLEGRFFALNTRGQSVIAIGVLIQSTP